MTDHELETSDVSSLPDDTLPLLDEGSRRPRDSIHAALLEDRTPEILFLEDAIGDTDSEHEEEDEEEATGEGNDADNGSTADSLVFGLDDDKLVMFRSTGRVSSKEKWGHEPLATGVEMHSVAIDMSDGLIVKVEGCYAPGKPREQKGRQHFVLHEHEVIVKVYLFRIRREIHAIQFVTDERTSDRYGDTKRGELCKAVEAPEGKFIASFFGDISRGEEDIDLGFRFAERPADKETVEADVDVAEIDHVTVAQGETV
ncbi:unnamed protein product [Hyaloperonospora brassicae]|uniref:Jacalin-type lectin domain-containing protein n=1 Tax=Hyaloperonospora brassicae TaxID=162125 RepID=A0AAV0TIS4_HYABA|nr:unnamed protein product [Hyaloperonospora brassicae]